VRQFLLPIGGNLSGAFGDLVDVAGECQRHHVGIQSFDHRARLAAGAAMRHADGDGLALLRLPFGGEGGVDLFVKLAGRIVGDIEQHGLPVGESGDRDAEREGSKSKQNVSQVAGAGDRHRDAPVATPDTLSI
jgi:hypothetical protein